MKTAKERTLPGNHLPQVENVNGGPQTRRQEHGQVTSRDLLFAVLYLYVTVRNTKNWLCDTGKAAV